MKIMVMYPQLAGTFRLLCAAFVWLFFCVPAWAGEIRWEQLADRERLSIRFGETEGMAGAVGRIELTGLVVPFTRVPAGVLLDRPPAGAVLVKNTRVMGQALVIETQTPEFGFVVSRQTQTELVIDFFPNPLGARWRPTAIAPTTEIAPDIGVLPPERDDAATLALAADPQGARPETAALLNASPEPPVPPVQGGETAPAAQTQPGTGTPTSAQDGQPAPPPVGQQVPTPPDNTATTSPLPQGQPGPASPAQAGNGAPGQRPVVVNLSGTPEHATSVTQMAQAPPVEVPVRPLQPRFGNATTDDTALLSAIEERGEAATPLSAPPPPLPVSDSIRGAGPSALPDGSAGSGAKSQGSAEPLPLPPAGSPTAPPSSPAVAPVPPSSGAASQQEASSAVPQAPEASGPATSTPANGAPALGPGIGVPVSPGVYAGSINIGGLEDIGADGAATPGGTLPETPAAPPSAPSPPAGRGTAVPETPAAPPSAPSPPAGRGTAVPETKTALPQANATIVYTDASGKEIPPPPDPVALMPEIRQHVLQGEFDQALEKANLLLSGGIIDRDMREELLHIRAEMLFVNNKDKLSEHYLEIVDATNQAINFNQSSSRNAGALLRQGYVNLKVNNITEAEAFFNMLRRKFPDDDNVPLTYYYWGEYHFSRNEMQKAADEFQYILQEFPNSRYARDAALGLARSYYRLGYYEQAFTVVDYAERRWERYYLDYPPFLNMIGDIAFRLNRLDDALRKYWLYMNLKPFGEEADIALTRLGDIYTMKREKFAAKELYTASAERFPDKDGGLVAMMRLAEDGMNDMPSIVDMFSVFEQPFSRLPVEVYRNIIDKHPDSALVPLAIIKLALWHLWNKQYEQSLDILSSFLDKYPKHELAARAREIMFQAFSLVAAEGMREQRYGQMREIWEKYAGVRGQVEALTPESRVALAISYRHNAKPNETLEILEPLFYGDKIPQYSEMALSLVLSLYLEYEQWQSILDVARRIDLWELTPEVQMQLDYAMALAGENLGNSALAAPLWQRLYDSGKLPPAQMAYATFFLARDAEKNRELEKAFFLGQEALRRLLEQVERTPNAADVGKIQTQLASLMDVAETVGRLREALAFAEQYMQYLGANDPERMAARYRMARIYKKQGDNDSWQKALTEIAAQAPGSVYGQLAASELKAASLAKDASQFSTTGRI